MKKVVGLLVAVTAVAVGSVVAVTQNNSSSHNSADVMFAQMMIPHHEQAIELAEMALQPGRGTSVTITSLAQAIRVTQGTEVSQMNKLLLSWGESAEMHGHESMMDGMVSASSMATLHNLTGPNFDAAWASAMVTHHRGAIAMARVVFDQGSNPEIRKLARHIIRVQRQEIATLAQEYPN